MKKLYVLPISILAGFFYFILSHGPKNFPVIKPVSRLTVEIPEYNLPSQILQEEMEKTMDPSTHTVPIERLDIARNIQLQRFQEQAALGIQSPVPGINWSERGPKNVGGRTRALMFDDRFGPDYPKVWAAGVGGGLWTTDNITVVTPVWTKVSDAFDNLAITCITQHPFSSEGNLMFFGTGEGWYNADGIRGNGIFRSLDGGITWTQLPSTMNNPDFYYVMDLKYVCCGVGPALIATTKTGGIQRSTDLGNTWTKVLGAGVGGGNTNEGSDLEFVYNYVFATMGIHSGSGGIYRSSNGGATWDAIYISAPGEGRIVVAANPNAYTDVYALITQNVGDSTAIKKIIKTTISDDTPPNVMNSWATVNNPTRCTQGNSTTDFAGGQGDYDLCMAIDPKDPSNSNTVYIGGIELYKTTNGGASWDQRSTWDPAFCSRPYVHSDIHEILFRPNYFPILGPALDLLIACDGGLFRTTDGGATFTQRNPDYNVTQFYSVAFHPTTTDYFLAGSQDNGTQRFNAANINNTTEVTSGDGGFCFIDQNDPTRQITSYIRNSYFISSNSGGNFTDYFWNTQGRFINPADYDNANRVLYAGGPDGEYFRWTNIPTDNPSTVSVSDFASADVTHVKVAPITSGRVYFGLDNGSVVRVDGAGGVTINSKLIKAASAGSVSCIAIDPANEAHILVTYSNYGVVSVFETKDANASGLPTWTSVEGNLPDMPVRWAMFDPRSNKWAILATEKGIWSTDNLNAVAVDWQPTNTNFANTRVDMLQYRASDRLLLAATHGRGLFTTTVPAGSPLPVTLVEFKGSLMNNGVLLTWSTSSEQKSKAFEIERSDEGHTFRKIGYVAAAGYSNGTRQYSFRDGGITQENNFYRLRQVDNDGYSIYSKVVSVKNPLKGQQLFTVLGNTFDDHIDLQIGGLSKGTANTRLYNMKGDLIYSSSVMVVPSSRMRLDLGGKFIPSGMYMLELVQDNKSYIIKLQKK
jgi:hypothetical protein